ncbi:unnamed protein product, partial [Brenthis ino]
MKGRVPLLGVPAAVAATALKLRFTDGDIYISRRKLIDRSIQIQVADNRLPLTYCGNILSGLDVGRGGVPPQRREINKVDAER